MPILIKMPKNKTKPGSTSRAMFCRLNYYFEYLLSIVESAALTAIKIIV